MLLISEEKESKETNKSIIFTPQNFVQFVGDYREINSDMTMHISKENDTLKAKGSMGKRPIPLLQSDKNLFVRLNAQNVKYDFTKTDKHDMTVSFGGTPFYFKRADISTKTPSDLCNYAGSYFSEELKTTYTFTIENNTIMLSYPNHKDIKLHPVELDKFGNNDRTLYHFTVNSEGQVNGMLLSCDGQVSNIEFIKDRTPN
jgi:hypothetical protein